jgi:hypothetical protein
MDIFIISPSLCSALIVHSTMHLTCCSDCSLDDGLSWMAAYILSSQSVAQFKSQ